jgi:hypothetical protein
MPVEPWSPHRVDKLTVPHDHVLVTDMNFDGRKLSSGILLLNDNGKADGIRPRWGRVYAIGSKQKDIQIGQYICVAHGRWTRGIRIEDAEGAKTIRRIDAKDILLVSDEAPPSDDTISTALNA